MSKARRVCIVGSGPYFLSGISYYTNRLAIEFAHRFEVSVILMRQLLPTRLYPGKARVGQQLASLRYPHDVDYYDGVNWYWIPSIIGALRRLIRARPEVVVFQWWSGTLLHTYLALAAIARVLGVRVVIEFHEVLDTGEAKVPVARVYVRCLAPLLMRLSHAFVIHSQYDRPDLESRYRLGTRPVAIIPHGPFDQYRTAESTELSEDRSSEGEITRLLYFGVIRPFKGVEDLVEAFNMIPESEIERYSLTIVGETWEGWTLPAERIAESQYRERIKFVNRYISDDEVRQVFANADAVVLPYHRSSASGPLHLAMSHGLPVIVTRVGGLVEAVEGYQGVVQVPAHDPSAIREAIECVAHMRSRRFADPHSWSRTVEQYDALFTSIIADRTWNTDKAAQTAGGSRPPNLDGSDDQTIACVPEDAD